MRAPKIRTFHRSVYKRPVTRSLKKLLAYKKLMKLIMNPIIPRPVTRSLKKLLDSLHIYDFVILENYRCMPLLGDEEQKVPDWEVHIVRYTIVYLETLQVDIDIS